MGFSDLPAPCILSVFCLAETSVDAIAWKCACKAFYLVCGKVDVLRLCVRGGDPKPAVAALQASSSEFSTWFGLDLDVAPMELAQQGRLTSPYVLRAGEAKLVEAVMKHLHSGIRWACLAEPASFCLPYHLARLSSVVTLELCLNPAMEDVVFHSAAWQRLAALRRLTLRGRLPPGRRRGARRGLPHLGPGVAHLSAHGLNLLDTEWAYFRQLRSLDLSESDVRLGPYCGGLLSDLTQLVLRDACLELPGPAIFADMARLKRLDLEGCTASRTASWLSRVLAVGAGTSSSSSSGRGGGRSGGGGGGGASASAASSGDVVVLPARLLELRAMRTNVFDKCALELEQATGLQLLELSSGAQLPATLKHAPEGAALGLHIADETHVVTRQGRDSVSLKACLAERASCIRRLSGSGLGRGALCLLGSMPELRRLCLLAGDRRRLELSLELPELEVARVEGYQIISLHLPVCLNLHTAVLSGHGVCASLALPPSTRSLVLLNVMRDARTLALATMVPRLKTAVLGMGWLPASLPPTVEQLAVVGEPEAEALGQALQGLQALLTQLPHLKQLRVTSGEAALPEAVSSLLPPGCQVSTAGVPREGPSVDCWGRSLHQTAPLHMEWCESVLTIAGIHQPAVEAGPVTCQLGRQVSRVLVS